LTPDGRHILEVNPVGEFFWLEQCLAPISKAIADILLGRF